MTHQTLDDFDQARADARIRAALDGVITIDADGIVIEWNPAAERIFGYSASEAVGESMASLIVPEHMRSAHEAGMRHHAATGEGPALDQRLEMPAITADGRTITIELTITAFTAGGRQWFTGWARDITQIKRTELELAQSERRFQAVVERSSDVVTILDAEGNWLYTSEAGTRLTGYPKGHNPPGGILTLLHADDVAVARDALEGVLTGMRGPDEPVELRIVGADGTVRWFETTGVNLLDDPAVRGVVLHARDVSERRATERELAVRTNQLSGILANVHYGVLMEDEDRRVAFANQAFADLFDSTLPPEAMLGADCALVADQVKGSFADPEAFLIGVDRCLVDREVVIAEEIAMADGRVLERDYVPVFTDDDVVHSHVWLYRDVTERKEAEQARERLLEAERAARRSIEEAQARLEEQNRSLRELDALKTELVATVSHELRTPLTSIVSFGELLDDATAGDLNETQRSFVDTIRRNADRLIKLVDDLLLLARLESETIHLEPTEHDLGRVLAQAVAAHAPVAAAKPITVESSWSDHDRCLIDPSRLQQVVDNLVSNAVKFTPAGGTVRVSGGATSAGYRIEVADTGIGIPEDEVAQLFSRFFRASNARQQMISGTGLGLAVCDAIVRLHGGTISVTSVESEGTTFTVDLPCAVEIPRG